MCRLELLLVIERKHDENANAESASDRNRTTDRDVGSIVRSVGKGILKLLAVRISVHGISRGDGRSLRHSDSEATAGLRSGREHLHDESAVCRVRDFDAEPTPKQQGDDHHRSE